MQIRVQVKLNDGSVIVRLFDSFTEVDEWMTRHKEHIASVEAKTILASQMRQGRYA